MNSLSSKDLSPAGNAAIDHFLRNPPPNPEHMIAGPLFMKLLKEQTMSKTDNLLRWYGADLARGATLGITGVRASGIIVDDPQNDRKPVKLPPYKTVGVRFIYGHTLEKIYTYRVRKGAKVHLGMEVIVPTKFGKRIAVIVEIHTTKQDTGLLNYLFIEQKPSKI